MSNFINQNNYAVAGVTTILYNIELDNLVEYSSQSGEAAPISTFIDVGFGYKKHSSSTYTYVSILTNDTDWYKYKEDVITYSNIKKLGTAGVTATRTFPYLVAITNLLANTEYDLVSYYITSGTTKVTFNSQTIKTLVNTGDKVNWTKGTTWDTVATEQYNSCEAAIQYCVDIINSLCNIAATIKFDIYYPLEGAAGEHSGNNIKLAPSYSDSKRVIMHELGHMCMYVNDEASEEQTAIKFMEWATHIPQNKWRWQALHNYPIISSGENNSIRDLYKRAAAFNVSRTI